MGLFAGRLPVVLGAVVSACCFAIQSMAQPPDAPPVPEVQEASPVDPALAGPEREINLLDEIKIELLDLEKLRAEYTQRMAGAEIRLSLVDCVLLALDSNQNILIASYDPRMAAADILAARGEFDPLLSMQVTHGKNHSTTRIESESTLIQLLAIQALTGQSLTNILQNVIFQGGDIGSVIDTLVGSDFKVDSYNSSFQLSLAGKSAWGTQYTLNFNLNQQATSTTKFDDQYTGQLGITLTQPLLRGFGKDLNLTRIRLAKNNLAVSQAQVELTVLTAIGEVIKAYWNLVGANENLLVRRESLENARRLVDISQRRFEIGTAAALEVLQAKAGVASRQGDFIAAQTAIANADDALKRLVSMQDGELFSSRVIVPTDRPAADVFDWDMEKSMRLALEYRPELRSGDLLIENAKLNEGQARNAMLPQLGVTAGFISGGHGDAAPRTLYGIRDNQDEIYSMGIVGSVPIGNRAARGGHQRARLAVRQAEQRLLKTREDVMLGVRIALRDALGSQVQVEANRQATKLQEASVAAEERRLRLGTTTSQRVLDIQEDLTAAQTQELQARISLENALVDLQVAEGTLLKNLSIAYAAPEDEGPMPYWQSINPVRPWRERRIETQGGADHAPKEADSGATVK